MLDSGDLVKELEALGIDAENYRVLSLLPLVLVAWSDGKVQRAERARIVEFARAKGLVAGGGEAVLSDWLDDQPLPHYYNRGFKVLVELARRERGLGSEMNADSLLELLDLSVDIAKAAGGLFGKAWSISAAERAALGQVAELLAIDDGSSWTELLEDLETKAPEEG